MSNKITPYLWFDDMAEDAANLYVSLFKNSKVGTISRYAQAAEQVSGKKAGSVMSVEFTIAGQTFIALNGGPVFSFTPAISFYVACESLEEIDRLYEALAVDGETLMQLDQYPFSERYGWVNDRFGVSWQLYIGESAQKITPCLMFTQDRYGKAEAAMKFYTSVFKNSKIEAAYYYEKDEEEKEGLLKHGVFYLDNNRFIAMDSGLPHAFTFTPATSFMVACRDQKEIDYFWQALSAVPAAEQCGWLADKYGVSWQIVPAVLSTLLNMGDPAKVERGMQALLKMKKLDIKELERAFG
jgi:predicted 3-demethylubiquinone-9 3-methyltransferase (glyoxalase superfamily)